MKKTALFGVAIFSALAIGINFAAAQEEDSAESKFNYTVVDGKKVDESTLTGYNIYGGSCMACHGPDGLGSSFAPSLVRAVQRRTFEDFAQTIAGGRSLQPGMVMPSFGEDMRVMSHIEDLWNYLGARAEGGLGRGRPRALDADNGDAAADKKG